MPADNPAVPSPTTTPAHNSTRIPPVRPPSCLEIEIARIESEQGWQEEYRWLADGIRPMTAPETEAIRRLALRAINNV
jgi:hypothetical protein